MEKIKTIYVIAYLLTALGLGTLFFGIIQFLNWLANLPNTNNLIV